MAGDAGSASDSTDSGSDTAGQEDIGGGTDSGSDSSGGVEEGDLIVLEIREWTLAVILTFRISTLNS